MSDNQTVSLQCPHCEHKSKQTIAWLQENATYACPGCGENLDTHGKAIVDQMQELLAKLGTALTGDVDSASKKLAKFIKDLEK